MLAFVLNAGFSQFGVSLFTMHDQYLPPPPPAPPLPGIPGLFEGPAFMGAPPGFFLHKKAPTVLVDGNPGIQQGHDVGYIIPHIAIPVNTLMAVHTLLSKHKIMFPVSSVHLEGKPVGTNVFLFLGLICSNPVSLPTGGLVLIKNTVTTSASLGDILKGLAYIAIDIAFDLLWNRLKGALFQFGGKKEAAALIEKFLADMAIEDFDKVFQALTNIWSKQPVWDLVNKLFQHIVKSWIVGPVVTGAPRGTPSIGRGKAGWKPFKKEWW